MFTTLKDNEKAILKRNCFFFEKSMLSLQPVKKTTRPSGGIGRHASLRGWWLIAAV